MSGPFEDDDDTEADDALLDEYYAEIDRLRRELTLEIRNRDYWKAQYDGKQIELAEAQDNWWKHPKAQLEIGLKARLSLRLQHIESIVHGTPRDEIGIDDDYWCDLCDKVLAMRDKLAEARGLLRDLFADPSDWQEVISRKLYDRLNAFLAADQPTGGE